MSDPVRLSHRVSLVNTDFVQTHFSEYFRWIDLAFQAFIEENGHSYETMQRDSVGMPLVDVRCTYLLPLRLGATFETLSSVESVGRTSFGMRHDFVRGADLVATATARHVCASLGALLRPVEVPAWIRALAPTDEEV